MMHRQLMIIFLALCFMPSAVLAEETSPEFTHSQVNYTLPDVTVIRQDGKKVSLRKELNDGRPVVLNFIFSSCSAICPMLSHTFSRLQDKLGKAHLVSISIDPENDTPEKLLEYRKKFTAGKHWDHYTGTIDTSIAIQKAFDAFGGDKMNHSSVIFIRPAPNKPWRRLDGFVSPDAVLREYNNSVK